MRFLCVAILLFCQASLAEVKYLEQGATAPYAGYLFSRDQEKIVRQAVTDLPIIKAIATNQDDLINNLEGQLKIQAKQVNNLKGQLSQTSLEKWFYFGAGILVTGAAIYLGGELRK